MKFGQYLKGQAELVETGWKGLGLVHLKGECSLVEISEERGEVWLISEERGEVWLMSEDRGGIWSISKATGGVWWKPDGRGWVWCI